MEATLLTLDRARWLELWRARLRFMPEPPALGAELWRRGTFGFPAEGLRPAWEEAWHERFGAPPRATEIPAATPGPALRDIFALSLDLPAAEVERDPAAAPPPSVSPAEALTFAARVNYLKWVEAGQGLSYGHTFVAKRRSFVATVALGYGDGYARFLSNRGQARVRGARVPVVGRVCMDQTLFDLTDHPERETLRVGEPAVAAGGDPDWAEVARAAGVSVASLLGSVGPRVRRTIEESLDSG